ncbi:MAG: hypothetical protein ACXV5H_11950 [Halobacteriota archaeon]
MNVDATTTLSGRRLAFEPDVKEWFAVTFNFHPVSVSYSVGVQSQIRRSGSGVSNIIAKGCKILWDYEIPIVINDMVKITGTMVKLPVHVGLLDEFKVDTRVGEIGSSARSV